MKKWIIILGSVSLLIFLIVRGIYKTVHRIDDEKHWYVSQLRLHCTLKVDSIAIYSIRGDAFLLCKLVSGEINDTTERTLNRKLKRYKRLRFLNHRVDGRYSLHCRGASNYQRGDSLQIDSGHDEILFFRKGESMGKAKVSNYLLETLF